MTNGHGIEENEENVPVDENTCGFGKWAPKCLQIFSGPKSFTLVVCIISAAQGFLVGGLTAVNLRDLEKHFGFSSKEASYILISNDISGLLLVPLVSFYGEKRHKPKWIGLGSIVIGIGVVLMILPKLLIGTYQPLGDSGSSLTSQSLCDSTNATTINKCIQSTVKSSGLYLAIFCLAQAITGAGVSPILTLGVSYIDENVDPKSSPVYLGIIYATTMIGPGIGFVAGGLFLSIYVDIYQIPGVPLTPSDSRWIGAWWLGYATCSWILFLSGLIMMVFPKEMSESRKNRLEAIKYGVLPSTDNSIVRNWRGMIKATIKLLSNKTFIFAVLGLTSSTLFAASIGIFFPKFVAAKYGATTSYAGILGGIVMFPAILVGIGIGSAIMKKTQIKDSAKIAAVICTLFGIISLVMSTLFLLPGCKDTNLAGAKVPYFNSSKISSLYLKCNTDCGRCSRDRYDPICGSDRITYFSPCFAGCKNKIKNTKMYGNCSCIPILKGTNTTSRTATNGRCDRDCKNMVLFVALVALFAAMAFIRATPHKMIILRSVPENQRSYALGLQFLITRLLAFTPGPVIMGAIFDGACSAWGYNLCGERGACYEFNVATLSYWALLLASLTSAVSILFYFLSWILYKPADHAVAQVNPDEADINMNAGPSADDKMSTRL